VLEAIQICRVVRDRSFSCAKRLGSRNLFILLMVVEPPGRFVEFTVSSAPNLAPVSKNARPWKKFAAITAATAFVLWIGLVGFIWRAMHEPPEDFARVMSHMPWEIFAVVPFETLWTHARAGTLNLGDSAPNFSLLNVDKSASVRLSELNATRPVVMIFGSYT
jgi:hypothetical protein